MKKLSIIVPVYNTELYLEKCLTSIIKAVEVASMRDETEIIIINDGSKDNSQKLIDKFVNENQDIIICIEKENKGLANTKNLGLEKSQGEYISFIDSDDSIIDTFYKDAFEKIYIEDADIVIYDWETVYDNIAGPIRTAAVDLYEQDEYWALLKASIMPSSCNKVVKKELFGDLKFPEGYKFEDMATTPVVLLRAKNIKYIPKMGYKYYIRQDSIMRTEFSENKFQMIDIFELLYSRLETDEVDSDTIDKLMVSVYVWRLYAELINQLRQVKDRNIRKNLSIIFLNKVKPIHEKIVKTKYYEEELSKIAKGYQMMDKLVNKAIRNQSEMTLEFVFFVADIYKKIKK